MHQSTANAIAATKASAAAFLQAADALRTAKGIPGRGEIVRYDFKGWEVIARGTYVECKAPLSMLERGDGALTAANNIERHTEPAQPSADSLLSACQRIEDRISRAVEKWGAAT